MGAFFPLSFQFSLIFDDRNPQLHASIVGLSFSHPLPAQTVSCTTLSTRYQTPCQCTTGPPWYPEKIKWSCGCEQKYSACRDCIDRLEQTWGTRRRCDKHLDMPSQCRKFSPTPSSPVFYTPRIKTRVSSDPDTPSRPPDPIRTNSFQQIESKALLLRPEYATSTLRHQWL